ncbi:uncharacterized protein LOC106363133 [Brassica napus]|uniref:uncharacterized protein LOC106297135 n=1 Tax=Brassica oleracea var. oleracea TaxID=109376 RepID=UPI0006A73D98|nr:PREDICTED: uncharacterized protein LOC106297135 [Brassica oleracea var. oleracea]XP_013658381.1 uncharacterized protein LOC106363133 [Brassica napus]
MPPQKQTPEEQQEELRATLENFTTTLRETLLHAVETALTTVIQRQQQPQDNAANQPREDDTDEDLADNLFANEEPRNIRNQVRNVAPAEHQLNRREHQPEERRWDMGFHVEIPEFNGNLNTEEFLDWLSSIEEILEYKRVPGDQCVPLIASRFKNRAMAWWQQIKELRHRAGKPRIDTWERLKKHMRRAFLPYNYERTLYNKLQTLRQGSRSVDEYATDFFLMVARTILAETEEQLVSRFIGGLRFQIQTALQQFNPTTVSEAHQRALAMELQFRSSWNSGTNRARNGSQSSDSTTATDATQPRLSSTRSAEAPATNTETIAQSRPARTGALRCFTCGETGHRQTACPNQNRRGLLNQDINLEDEPKYDEYDSDSQQEPEIELIAGDTGAHTLVLRRNCLLPRSTQESWLRSTLFRSTCTINGKICKLIIDSGSCTNVLSALAVKKLDLKTVAHPSPYKLAWLNKGIEITVSRQTEVSFSIGSYLDTVCCDVVPMDACHLLLGRPWQFDKDATHRGKSNTYSFEFKGRTVTLLPSPEHQTSDESSSSTATTSNTKPGTTLLMLPKAEFEAQV